MLQDAQISSLVELVRWREIERGGGWHASAKDVQNNGKVETMDPEWLALRASSL